MNETLAFGLDTFGDVTVDTDGKRLSGAEVIRNVVEQAVLADRVGVDAFGIGEHHRDDFAVTAPEVVLAAIAARTERIKLGTAVTVLSSDDPIRVYERFATLDAISNGRAEITLGRGSFTESFPLFGYDLDDYEKLFKEKLDLFAAVHAEQPFSWQGTVRAPLENADVFPKTESGSITTWIGVGGTPESVVRAARYGFGLMLAIIGGDPARFAPYAELYRRALAEARRSRAAGRRPLARLHRGHRRGGAGAAVPLLQGAARPDRPRARLAAGHARTVRRRGRPRRRLRRVARRPSPPRSPAPRRRSELSRFDLKYSNGALPHDHLMHAIELYGTEVIPRVRELLD